MRNGACDTPTGQERKNVVDGAEKSSGKKLVQARLPFKKIAGEGSGSSSRKGSASAKDAAVVPAAEKGAHQETRKRKLSFEGAADEQEEEQSERILRDLCAIKGNVLVSAKKKKKVDGSGASELILLDDDDQDNVVEVESVAKATKGSPQNATPASPVTPQPAGGKRGKGAGTQGSGQSGSQDMSGGSNRKLHIKLPLGVGSSGKRRKPISELLMKTATSVTAVGQMEHSDDGEASGAELPLERRQRLDEAEKENKEKEKEVVVTIALDTDSESLSELGSSGATEELDGADYEGSCSSFKCETGAESAQAPTSPNFVKVKEVENGMEVECTEDNRATVVDVEEVKSERNECGANAVDSGPSSMLDQDSTPVTVCLKEIENTDEQQRATTAECPEQVAIALDSSDCTDTTNDKDQPAKPQGGPKEAESQIGAVRKRHLTPKQQKLLEQRRQVREEKERRLQEERLQKQREKEAKEVMRKREREEREEQRRKEREERDEQKRKERQQKERARLAELEAKNEEKRKRNEAKEEELRKKEEERRRKEQEKEEAEQKAKKAADAFQKFFKPKRTAVAAVAEAEQGDAAKKGPTDCANKITLAFRPFEVKGDMSLAPVSRKTLSMVARKELDRSLKLAGARAADGDGDHNDEGESSACSQLYLAALKSGKITPEKWRRRTVDTKEADDDDVLVMDDLEPAGQAIVEETHVPIERCRAKFYKFWENRRPPYFGTWRKKTSVVSARRPFAQDKQFFDYDVDSDLEWEEEEPGESLDGSDDDKEKESEDDDYEVDNEWFVPHGHLSEEELQHEDDADANTREAQQAKLKILQREFAQEMKKKTEKLKPRLIGCIWADENGNQPTLCPKIIWDTLCQRAMLCAAPPLLEDADAQERTEPGSPTNGVEKSDKLKPIALNERMLRDLTRLVHGNRHSKNFLIKEFIAYLEASEKTIKSGDVRGPLKSMVREKIDEYAEWQAVDTKINNKSQEHKRKNKKRLCWIVADNVLQRMGLACIGLHNSWQYTLQPKFANADRPVVRADEIKTAVAPADETNCVVTDANTGEVAGTVETTAEPANVAKAKKRVPLLMSVARGQKIPQPAKNALISEYLKRSSAEKAAATKVAERATPTVAPLNAGDVDDVADDDDVVMLD